jgi:alpha/beta superfamily hydrolase
MARRIETLFVPGPAGRLEALLEEPEEGEPRYVALVCHPHPQHGGTMHNKVVYRLARGLRRTGAVVLRFNYRGVNLSEGVYADGIGELEDARACLALLRDRYSALPFVVAGFSFGSRIALQLASQIPAMAHAIAVGFPTKYPDKGYLEPCTVPRTFLHSTIDVHGPMTELVELTKTLSGPPAVAFIPAKDHFFADALDAFEDAVVRAGETIESR